MTHVAATIGDFPIRNLVPVFTGRTTLPAPPKSMPRLAVEEVLRHTNRSNPLTVDQLAARTGLDPAAVRGVLNGLVGRGIAENVTPHQLPASYAWRRKGARAPMPNFERPWLTADLYDGKELRPYQGRPGAMDAYALPSLVDGVRVPRRAPMLVGESL